MVYIYVVLVCLLWARAASFSPLGSRNFRKSSRAVHAPHRLSMALGGKIVVSGIGSSENDEFMLNLLNEQVSVAVGVSFIYRNPSPRNLRRPCAVF